MNCRGCRQRFLPLPDLSRKIEGDSVRRVRKKGTVNSLFLGHVVGKQIKPSGSGDENTTMTQ